MAERRRSIRRELLAVLLAAVAATWIATAIFSYFDARHEIDELLDAHLAQSASLLIAQLDARPDEPAEPVLPRLDRHARRVVFEVWAGGTTLALRSQNAPGRRLSTKDDGYAEATLDGRRWRVFSQWDERRRYLVEVAERSDARGEVTEAIARNLMLPFAVALPLLGAVIWFGIARGLRPLRAISREVEVRAPDRLDSLEAANTPAEIAPLVASLNRLFARVRDSLERERRFTADAAHELRTPLAALRAQAQVAQGAASDAERRRALDRVIEGCDRATHLVEQLLTLARIDPQRFEAGGSQCELRGVARDAIAEAAPVALARGVEVELADGSPLEVRGDASLLRILLRNLVDNAVRYGPAPGVVRVATGSDAWGAFVSVRDDGAGIAGAEAGAIGERFQRFGAAATAGTGLGLSIAKRIAELHRGRLDFERTTPGPGFVVTLRLDRGDGEPSAGRSGRRA